jgi:hypothetical protein
MGRRTTSLFWKILAAISACALLTGCVEAVLFPDVQYSGPRESYPTQSGPAFRLYLPEGEGDQLESGSSILLEVENLSSDQIWFYRFEFVEIYWVVSVSEGFANFRSVDDKINRVETKDIVLAPAGSEGSVATFLVTPDITASETSLDLLIIVTGRVLRDGVATGELETAQILVTVQPNPEQ